MFYGWRVVGGAFFAQMIVVGFFSYAVSLLVAPVREEFGVSLEQVMYSMTAATFIGLFLQPVGGILVDRWPVRWLMAGGALAYGLGMFAVSRAGSIGQYILFFAITMSVSNAFAGPLSSSAVISRWFTASRGKALGIAAVGTSVGGLIIPALIAYWLEQSGWRVALQNLSLLILTVMLPAVVLLIRGRPADVGLQAEPGGGDGAAAQGNEFQVLGLGDIARKPAFWLIGFSLGLLFCVYSAVLTNLTPYATNLGQSTEQASALIMAVAISGLIGKILFGMAADRFSLRSALWVAQTLVALSFLLLATEPAYALMVVAACLLGLAAGGMLPVWGAMMAKAFGLASFGRAMGLMGPIITLCVMPGFPVIGRLYDMTGSYTTSLYLFTGVMVLAAALLLPLNLDD